MIRIVFFPVALLRAATRQAKFFSAWRAFVVAFLLAASSFLPLRAQVFDASLAGGPVVITAPWRFHTGDDPHWSSPSFDDSQWPLLRMDRSWNVQGYRGYSGYAWYRIRLQVPTSRQRLALALDRVGNSAEIYADGQPIGEMGQMRPKPDWLGRLPRTTTVIPLPPVAYGKTIVLAIRAWESARSAPAFDTGSAEPPRLGTEQAIRELNDLTIGRSLFAYFPDWTIVIVAVVIGLISLGLFLLRPRALEYAWAALYLFGEASIRGFDPYRQIVQMPTWESAFAIDSMRAVTTICWLLLVWSFMRCRADWLLRAGMLLTVLMPIDALLVMSGHATIARAYVVRALVLSCIGLLIFARLVLGAWRGNHDAQIFLAPFLLYSVMDVVRWIRGSLYYAGLSNTAAGLELYRGAYFTVTWDRIGFLLSYLAVGAVLVRRFTQSAQQEQRLATEMESAKEVQAQLVPTEFPRLSGLQIEAAYLPASEVGGDFYQVVEQSDGAVLIVMGDVCGKGLKAAMTGVLAIGAARALASQELHPGLLLTRLNREMTGSQNGGFITCVCARVGRQGAITFANAGHPPPYRNGEEIPLDASFPLGITPEVEYAETTICLDSGDKVTFVSDGVLEARSETSGIFGFDRTREISRLSAQAIAKAAQQFGQEDDITVLTLSFSQRDRVIT